MIFPSFPWFSYIFSMIFPYIFHYFPKCFHDFPIFSDLFLWHFDQAEPFFFFRLSARPCWSLFHPVGWCSWGRAQSQVGRWGYSHPVGRFLWENHSYIISRFYGNIIINNRKKHGLSWFFWLAFRVGGHILW
jgi:hypothetical protein